LKILIADALLGERHVDELKMLQRTMSADTGHLGYSRIVSLLDYFEHSGPHGTHLCLVLELLGASVGQLESLYAEQNQAVPYLIVKRLVKQVLDGLDYLHQCCGIAHTGKHFIFFS
jgi:serine/threonine-protein kinase SRPK3